MRMWSRLIVTPPQTNILIIYGLEKPLKLGSGGEVLTISSDKYSTIEEVSAKTRWMAGVKGARCTTELKKIPRRDFQKSEDVHIFGFTSDERGRIDRFENNNPEIFVAHPLKDCQLTKDDCYLILEQSGIELPAMYGLGFKNNNCIGCYKATSAQYWNRVRFHFPEVFARRAKDSRELGVRLTRYKGDRIFLDQLPPEYLFDQPDEEDISCGPECGQSA